MTATPANENNKQYNNNNNNTNNNNDNNNNAILCFIPFKSALASRHLIMTKNILCGFAALWLSSFIMPFFMDQNKATTQKARVKKKKEKNNSNNQLQFHFNFNNLQPSVSYLCGLPRTVVVVVFFVVRSYNWGLSELFPQTPKTLRIGKANKRSVFRLFL